MLGSYVEHPSNCKFNGQNDNENIVLFLRSHPITNLSWIFGAIFVGLIPLFIPYLIDLFNLKVPTVPQSIITGLLLVDALAVSFIVIEGFLHWYFNANIVTNSRIVDIDFENLLSNNIDHASLNSVEEANGRVAGILGLLFNYGNVSIQTAGAISSLDFPRVPNPGKVADIINDEADKAKRALQGGGNNAGHQPH